MDPRTPVIVGAAQRNWRDGGNEPIATMATTATDIFDADGAAARLRDQVASVRVVGGIWPYKDPGRLLAAELGIEPVETTMTHIGGNEAYELVAATAEDLQGGAIDVALIASSETMRTRRKTQAAGNRFTYRPEADGATATRWYGSERALAGDAQKAAGADAPVTFYALAEVALGHRLGLDVAEHQKRIAGLWARASAVAANNPAAWIRDERSAAEIAEPSDTNRMVTTPYTKLLTANVNVDQSAAALMCTYEAAVAAGIDPSAMVFLHSGTGAADRWTVRERLQLDASPAMRIAGSRALELAGWRVDDIEDLDLYSCFPVAVEVAQREMGIDFDRPFTITGGLTFAGGPLNSYCMHALVTATERIKAARSARTFVTGNGGYLTKHSFLTMAPTPPPAGFHRDHPQDAVYAEPARPVNDEAAPSGIVEAYTVRYDRDNAPEALVATVLDGEYRSWAVTNSADLVAAATTNDLVGANVDLEAGPAPGVHHIVAIG